MSKNNTLTVQKLSKQQLQSATNICGVTMGKIVFAMLVWLCILAAVIVVIYNAPNVSVEFKRNFSFAAVGLTVVALMFSRPTEGWPSVIVYADKVGVVFDPSKREFVLIPFAVISNVEQSVVMPNKSVLLLSIQADALNMHNEEHARAALDMLEDGKISVLTHQSKKHTLVALQQLQNLIKDH